MVLDNVTCHRKGSNYKEKELGTHDKFSHLIGRRSRCRRRTATPRWCTSPSHTGTLPSYSSAENLQWEKECIPVGCVPAARRPYAGVCFPGGGGLVRGGWGVCTRGGLVRGGWYPSMHWGRPPLWTEWMTDRCKNITLATTLLRPVKINTYNDKNVQGLMEESV